MRTQILNVGLCLTLATPVMAQTLVAADPNQASIKLQVKNFEAVLRNAVDLGGQKVGERARQVEPSIRLYWVSDVGINGWWQRDSGYIFDITIPDIAPTSAWLLVQAQKSMPAARSTPPAVKPVANGERPVATTIPNDDRVIDSPVVPFDPNQFFSDAVRQALIDAMIENTGGLQFKSGQTLRIVAGPGPQMVPNPLSPDSRKLILTVKGEDLIAFRQNQIKREDLLARIQEERF